MGCYLDKLAARHVEACGIPLIADHRDAQSMLRGLATNPIDPGFEGAAKGISDRNTKYYAETVLVAQL